MPENKPVIGLTWEPKLPSLSSTSSSSVSEKPHVTHENVSLYKPTSELLNGLYLPPNDPRKLNKLVRKQIKDTTGNSWFDMPAAVLTPELKQDLQLLKVRDRIEATNLSLQCASMGRGTTMAVLLSKILKRRKEEGECGTKRELESRRKQRGGGLRGVMDPKRHYKKSDAKSKTLPKYFQVGTIVESASDFYSSRLTKKERKARIADELLSDSSLTQYRKRKVREIEELNQPGGNEKWKIRGKHSKMRAKERRQKKR
ncbi:hypothetical protein Cgig2_028633 [Carnegiea gigantea]|uniref:Fcf2 pre-rRNA processing C-terminal domain-containing protein n=1 Tax=Carnegiea gigantea TaxID=171969 RepID=A0A9Q1JUE7_9CARY|nr:hypothetical protein Cgig2_028633 [Carnegiea gigantea]